MKGLLSSALLFALSIGARAEVVCALGSNVASYKPGSDERPSPDVMQLAKRVNDALTPVCSPKCPEIAVYRNATAANAMLIVTSDQAKIVYAPQFFSTVYDSYGDGAILAVIAHEYGHALAETVAAPWMKTAWSAELRADAWAACTLAKINLSSKSLGEALAALSKYPPSTHPAWNSRLTAIQAGYAHCGGNQPIVAPAAVR